MNSTNDEILSYLKEKSIDYIENKQGVCDTNSICNFLCLSRSRTSQYLNTLFDSGMLIKIKARPVIYLNRETIETTYNFKFNEISFEDEEAFFDFIHLSITKKRDFSKLIGYNTSLRFCIVQCQSALKYPPSGLPILLIGEKGVGKKLLSQTIYEYLINEHYLDKSDPYIIFNCNLEKAHDAQLFGYYENNQFHAGLLQKMKSGVVYINHCEYLSIQAIEKFKNLFQNDRIKKTDDSLKISKSIRFVFSCEQKSNDWKSDSLQQIIPITINVPNLDERLPEERKKFIYTFIKKETKSISNEVFISNSLLQTLMNAKFKGNIDQLNQTIKICCVNAFQSNKDISKGFNLLQYHLPNDLLLNHPQDSKLYIDDNLIPIENLVKTKELCKLFYYYNKVISLYETFDANNMDNYYQNNIELMNEYFDFMIFNQEYFDNRVQSIENIITSILDTICSKYLISLPRNFAFIIARIIYFQLYFSKMFSDWEKSHDNLDVIYKKITNLFKDETGIITDLDNLIYQSLDVKLDTMNNIFLVFYVSIFNKKIKRKYITSIILSHGYSTASSIADTCNRFLGKHIFDAIDMPLDTSATDVVNKLILYFSNNYVGKEVILLVDMGSLENIGSFMRNIPNLTIGIINNISTGVALSVGEKIINQLPFEDILKQTCEETIVNYQIVSEREKEYAIIFTSETGITHTDRMIQLFKNSLPTQSPIRILSYDYYELLRNLKNDELLKHFNILFITGTIKVNVPHVTYFPLEDIINCNKIDQINQALSAVFSKEEIELFNKNLMKYFSIESILNHITILNPELLMNFVSTAVDRLEFKMGTNFSARIKIGMYIHVSCLIERLVTKNGIESYLDLDEFIEKHQIFIDNVLECFSDIITHYNVELPIAEIAYLFDYVNND